MNKRNGPRANFRASEKQKANVARIKRQWKLGPGSGLPKLLCRVCGVEHVSAEGKQCQRCAARQTGKQSKKTWRIPKLNIPKPASAGSWWVGLNREALSAAAVAQQPRMAISAVSVRRSPEGE